MEPPSSQAIDEDNQEAVINANVAELESQYEDHNDETLMATPPVKANDNIPQPSAPKKQRKNPTSTGTRGKQPASSKRKLQFTDDDVEEEDEQPSSLGNNKNDLILNSTPENRL